MATKKKASKKNQSDVLAAGIQQAIRQLEAPGRQYGAEAARQTLLSLPTE